MTSKGFRMRQWWRGQPFCSTNHLNPNNIFVKRCAFDKSNSSSNLSRRWGWRQRVDGGSSRTRCWRRRKRRSRIFIYSVFRSILCIYFAVAELTDTVQYVYLSFNSVM